MSFYNLIKRIGTEGIIVSIGLPILMVITYFLDIKGEPGSCSLGIQPFHFSGLKGVLMAPLLHSDIFHLLGNVIPLVALFFLCFQFFGKITYYVIPAGWILVGLMVWIFPTIPLHEYSNTCHIGASGLLYTMVFFMLFSGIFNKDKNLIALTLVMVVSYGSLIWGIFPEELLGLESRNISWQSHLSGMLVGILFSYIFRNKNLVEEKKFDWEGKSELSERDQLLWDTYLEILEQDEINEQNQFLEDYYHNNNQSTS